MTKLNQKDNSLLQAIINEHVFLKKSLFEKIDKMDKRNGDEHKEIRNMIQKNTKRLDRIGSQLAFLEDDAPTTAEHEDLEKRVTKLEKGVLL